VLAVGERIPEARVWRAPGEDPVALASFLAGGPCLFLFYLYDWSST
jgi:hypothetical protein